MNGEITLGKVLASDKNNSKNSAGNKYYLKPLSTEGLGFLENRPYYKINQVSIPFGGGVKFALNDNVRLGFEVGMRKLFTNYLDDVSTTYAGKDLLFFPLSRNLFSKLYLIQIIASQVLCNDMYNH